MSTVQSDDSLIVQMRGIWASYKKNSTVLKGINMSVNAGDCCAIVGPSGSGKSTLLKIINGMMMPSRGVILVDSQKPDHNDRSFHSKMAIIGYIPQYLGLVRNSTVLDNLMIGALPRLNGMQSLLKRYPAHEIEFAHGVLKKVGLHDKADRNVYNLSGGERRRVAIARAFMQKPKILLADEMVSELDTATSRIIMRMVQDEQKKTGLTVVMIHHDLELATEFSDNIILIKNGQKVMELGNENNSIVKFQTADLTERDILEMYDDAKE